MKRVKLNEAGLRRMVRGMLSEVHESGIRGKEHGINEGDRRVSIEVMGVADSNLRALLAELEDLNLAYIVDPDSTGLLRQVTVWDPTGEPLNFDMAKSLGAETMELLNPTAVARAVAHRPGVPNRRVGGGPHAPERKAFSFPD